MLRAPLSSLSLTHTTHETGDLVPGTVLNFPPTASSREFHPHLLRQPQTLACLLCPARTSSRTCCSLLATCPSKGAAAWKAAEPFARDSPLSSGKSRRQSSTHRATVPWRATGLPSANASFGPRGPRTASLALNDPLDSHSLRFFFSPHHAAKSAGKL